MGTELNAQCKCGFNTYMTQGAGMSTYEHEDWEPAYCEQCQNIVNVNYKNSNPKCPNCKGRVVFYNDPVLQKKKSAVKASSRLHENRWGDFILPATYFLCPKCKKKTLWFESGILFD